MHFRKFKKTNKYYLGKDFLFLNSRLYFSFNTIGDILPIGNFLIFLKYKWKRPYRSFNLTFLFRIQK